MKTYASLADLKRRLSITGDTFDDDLALALVTATRYVDLETGSEADGEDAWTGSADDLALASTPTAALVNTTLHVAIRFYKSADVPFGVAGMTDQGMVAYVRSSIPEAQLMLLGQRTAWGIA